MESLRSIVSFVRTASAGSFSAAARQLGVTTVSVSRNVQRLERNLGVRLLNRTTRSLSLTEEGRALYEMSRHALAELEAAHDAIVDRGAEAAGLVRATTVSSLGRLYVLPLLKEFRERYPKVQVELLATDRIVDMIAEGFDVGVRAGSVPDANIVVRKLADVPRVVCAAPAYIERQGEPAAPDDLVGHDCISFRLASTGRLMKWEFRRDGDPFAIEVRGSLVLNDMLAVCDAAVAGLGLAQLPTYLATPYLRDGRLQPVLIDFAPPEIAFFVHYPARRLQPARVRVFVDFLVDRLAGHPDLTFDPRSIGRPARDADEPASADCTTPSLSDPAVARQPEGGEEVTAAGCGPVADAPERR